MQIMHTCICCQAEAAKIKKKKKSLQKEWKVKTSAPTVASSNSLLCESKLNVCLSSLCAFLLSVQHYSLSLSAIFTILLPLFFCLFRSSVLMNELSIVSQFLPFGWSCWCDVKCCTFLRTANKFTSCNTRRCMLWQAWHHLMAPFSLLQVIVPSKCQSQQASDLSPSLTKGSNILLNLSDISSNISHLDQHCSLTS